MISLVFVFSHHDYISLLMLVSQVEYGKLWPIKIFIF